MAHAIGSTSTLKASQPADADGLIAARALHALQLGGTLLILVLVPANELKAACLLGWWGLTFGKISRAELGLFIGMSCFFTLMNYQAIKNGVFAFVSPNVMGMPYYELFMWGFYLLHTKRMVGDPPATGQRVPMWILTVLFALVFMTVRDQQVLFSASGMLLALGLALYHDPHDLAYVGYMIVLGGLIEYAGVWSGEWCYPDAPFGGVPPWFVTMWGGVGLFLRRIVLPWCVDPRTYPRDG